MCPKFSERITAGRTVKEVESLINENVFGKTNRIIMAKLLVDGETYEEIARDLDMSPRGIYYRVARIRRNMH